MVLDLTVNLPDSEVLDKLKLFTEFSTMPCLDNNAWRSKCYNRCLDIEELLWLIKQTCSHSRNAATPRSIKMVRAHLKAQKRFCQTAG